MSLQRCGWCSDDPLYITYHDEEWGVPLYDDEQLFEFLTLESMQAGLSWLTILKKRENFRRAFASFDPHKIARFSEQKILSLMQDTGIIRNRRKIDAVINNAKIYLQLKEQGESFSDYLWQFTDGKVLQNTWDTLEQVPATTPESDLMAKTLKQRGFKFIGSTICYAHMQATGMVNDHLTSCFRQRQLADN
ncbi:MAG: DNA-3-methyladenine glycosylase I [Legionellales bacterium]|nr:DNA-3-methyladenine glycosylase I [Legionellales bacterium]